MDHLDRIEAKLDSIDAKLNDHLERLAKAETSISWLRWVMGVLLTVTSTAAIALSKYIN
jgi:hypothetical protein